MNLTRSYQDQSLDRARGAIRSLATITIQSAAAQKLATDLATLEQVSLTGKISKEELTSRAGPALQRLRAAAKLLSSDDLSKELKKFPKYKGYTAQLTHDYLCLCAGAQPTPEEIAGFLPVLAQQAQIPIEFLESATGVVAQYDLPPMEVFEMPVGNPGAPMQVELFTTVEPKY
jgi:hypothetical protein